MIFPKHFLTLRDLSQEQIIDLLTLAQFYKDEKKRKIAPKKLLKNHFIAMIFTKASTRTRLAFEWAIADLGGRSLFLSPNDSQLSRGENLTDTLRVMERSSDIVVVRNHDHMILQETAKWMNVPLINALSDLYHPTEALADVMTMMEALQDGEKITDCKAVFLGDANNISRSFAIICHFLGIPCHIATPAGNNFPLLPDFLKDSHVIFSDDPKKAVRGAKFIYTDTWHSMGDVVSADFKKKFSAFQVNENLVKDARDDYIFLHCLPAYRGEEVVSSIIDGAHSRVFDQAENRTYTIKALLLKFSHL